MTDFSIVLDKAFSEETKHPKSWMGTEILEQITFSGGVFKEYGSNGKLNTLDLNAFVLPSTTLAQFSRAKELVKTKLLASPGTVKELFSYGDWKIELIVRCINDAGRKEDQSPQQQLKKLLRYDRVLGSIGVSGHAFEERGIDNIVIEQMEVLTKKGAPNTIDVRIRALSDLVPPMEFK